MEPGVYQNLPNEDYHADLAIGSSGLKAFGECPAIYWERYLNPDKSQQQESKYSMLGSYAHMALLEPELFAKTYSVAPQFATVNKGKKNEETKLMHKAHGDWKKFESDALSLGKEPLLHSEYLQASAMAAVIKNHSLASSMLTGGKAEMSFFAKDEETGLTIKARPDYLVKAQDRGVILVDYKTTSLSMGLSKQSNHTFSLGRHLQAAHHKKVTELATGGYINEVCYITQMQEAPYLVRIFRLPEEALDMGYTLRRQHLDGIAECHATGVWPGYPEEIEDFIVPRWMDYDFN